MTKEQAMEIVAKVVELMPITAMQAEELRELRKWLENKDED